MGIQIDKGSAYGVPATYHNVGSVQVDFKLKRVDAQIFGYANLEARQAGSEPLLISQLHLQGADFPTGEITREVIYASVMALPEWEGAQAV